jgi:hypothetical protein
MEVVCPSEMLVFICKSTRRYYLNFRAEDLKDGGSMSLNFGIYLQVHMVL